VIANGNLSLEAFDDSDLESYHRFRRDLTASRLAGVVQLPESLEDVRAAVAELRTMRTHLLLSIRDNVGTPVGFVELYGIDWVNRTLYTAMSVYDPDNRGRGIGTRARVMALDFVFNQMGFHRAYGESLRENRASLRVQEKIGAEISGERRAALTHEGRLADLVTYHVRRERFNSLHRTDLTAGNMPRGEAQTDAS
jgi:RimJ/RimL family protein N-acetyltransferase